MLLHLTRALELDGPCVGATDISGKAPVRPERGSGCRDSRGRGCLGP